MNSEQPFETADNAVDEHEESTADTAVQEQDEFQDDEASVDEDDHDKRGRVKFFNGHKGFGFIKAEDEEEYFVHVSDVIENLELDDNMPVAFNVEQGEKGPKAVSVKILPQDADLDLPDDVSDD